MSNTPRLQIQELANGANQNQVVNSSGYAILDQRVDGTVRSRGTNTPPGSPVDGDAYVIGTSPTGLWLGKSTQIAYWRSSAGVWQFMVPRLGWTVRVDDDLDGAGASREYVYTGSTWVSSGSGGFTGGTLTSALNEAPPATVASAASTGIGAAAANSVNVTGTTTIIAFDVIPAGATRRVIFQGILTLTHHATALILPTGANITTAAGDVAEFLSLGSGNWKCLAYQRASGQALSGGAGLSNWTDGLSNTSPNATIPVVSLTATNAATNVDAVLAPKGSGGVGATVADGTATGGNKRGSNAVDWQSSRSGATQVASGSNSTIGGGSSNTASGSNSTIGGGVAITSGGNSSTVAGGNNNQTTGNSAFIGGGTGNNSGSSSFTVICGGQSNAFTGSATHRSHLGGLTNTSSAGVGSSTTGGEQNTVNADYSIILGGYRSQGRQIYGGVHHANGRFANNGDAQWSNYLFRVRTTTATPADMTADAAAAAVSNVLTLDGGNLAWFCKIQIVARNTSNGEMAAWEANVLLRRGSTAASTAIVGTPTFSLIAADASLSGLAVPTVYVNATIGGGVISVTGIASTTIDWVARVSTVEAG